MERFPFESMVFLLETGVVSVCLHVSKEFEHDEGDVDCADSKLHAARVPM